jgi:hypothetical protein
MDSKRQESKVFNNNPPGKSTKRTAKKQTAELCETYINNYKIRNWKESSKNRDDLKKFIAEAKVRIGL